MVELKDSFDLVKTSYSKDDVKILLKDLSTEMGSHEMSTDEREKAIQSGVHYSEMLPKEKAPTEEYMRLYRKALEDSKSAIADGIGKLADMIDDRLEGEKPVIISLARAGIPIGILIKRYLKFKFDIDASHYAISIIRGRGIDTNAMDYIYNAEVLGDNSKVSSFIFVDGWTGKGMINIQLQEAVKELKQSDIKWKDLTPDLYVLADPANITDMCGTKEDFLIPCSCLNSTVSGLISRTILNKYIDVAAGEFHGAVYFDKFKNIDVSNEFIDTVESEFKICSIDDEDIDKNQVKYTDFNGMELTKRICKAYSIDDFTKVKPGIGETTRVLLRRVPWKVLINSGLSEDDKESIEHILLLCKEKHVETESFELGNYKVCGIIKELSADA